MWVRHRKSYFNCTEVQDGKETQEGSKKSTGEEGSEEEIDARWE